MKLKEYKLGLVIGKGRTITVARAHAERQAIEAIAKLDEGPLLLSGPPGGCVAIMISPKRGSWAYEMLESEQARSRGYPTFGFKTKLEAITTAILHASQNAVDYVDTKTAFTKLDAIVEWANAAFGDIGKAITLREGLRELRDRLAWRVRYDAWRVAGATDNEAHCRATAGIFPPVKETA